MKIFLPFLTFLIGTISLQAQEYQPKRILKKDYLPCVERLKSDYLYISNTELSNQQWCEYLRWLAKNDPEAHLLALPDTNCWRESLAYNEPFVSYYLRHPAYQKYPVVGVSQEQAKIYCNWVAQRIMESDFFKKSPIEKIIVRLPSEKEWILAARYGLHPESPYPWEEEGIRKAYPRKHQGEVMANIRREVNDNAGIAGKLNDKGFITTPVVSYWPNPLGLYNLAGNVSEWLEEPGMIKGGSWKLPANNARIDAEPVEIGPRSALSDVGFRYVIEIISLKKPAEPIEYVLDARYLEKTMYYVPGTDSSSLGVFASSYETPNWMYNAFLRSRPRPDFKIQDSLWNRHFRYDFFKEYGSLPFFEEHPVVNITYESAEAFCDWLTEVYNSSHKRKYRKVRIRLPTENEWERMAKGGRSEPDYPWGGPYVRNSKGCYIANLRPLEEQYLVKDSSGYRYNYPDGDTTISRDVDGTVLPARVNAYFPNDYGMYNAAGNVAEMISTKGISKGGSWNSDQNFIKIKARETYDSPDATLGFRFFLEVIEK